MSLRLTSPHLGVAAAFAIAISARGQDSFPAPSRFWAAQTAPDSISMNWSVVPGVRYYRLYSIPAGGTATAIGESRGATADWWVFPIKAYGQPLRFGIEAVSESGEVSRRVISNEVVPERTTLGPAPPAPVSARAAASSNGTVTVTWDVVPDATGYTISRTAIPGGNRVVCRLCAPTGSFVDTDAVSGSKHTYRVVAITPKGTSRGVVSNEVTPSAGTAPTAATVPTAARGTFT